MSSWTPTSVQDPGNWAEYNFHSNNEDRYHLVLIQDGRGKRSGVEGASAKNYRSLLLMRACLTSSLFGPAVEADDGLWKAY